MIAVGNRLAGLHRERNRADYDGDTQCTKGRAISVLEKAKKIVVDLRGVSDPKVK
jgi:hypothetical protein